MDSSQEEESDAKDEGDVADEVFHLAGEIEQELQETIHRKRFHSACTVTKTTHPSAMPL